MENTNQHNFILWLEFEHSDYSDSDMENELCNVIVDLPDGRRYGINVWTYKFLETIEKINQNSGEELAGLYIVPPDLFVKVLTRECIEKTISDLLKRGNLEDVLNPSVLS
ncbi:hypothetical protein AMR72_12455 [Flavobacterium psychrophilum]|nr:hypothetical protein AMR72_12455 [Flavobacterium psychrophilum]AOE53259.1 hypothetical protein ALW18_12445 [Flavobacterium psychrophilum]